MFQFLILIFFLQQVNSQLVSPCPNKFRYEPTGRENDRWYGVLTLLSDADTSGVWIRVILDKPSIQLGNWFGEVVTSDNKDYLIKKPTHMLKANVPENVRFYIKYNPNETPPQLISFRLNARVQCPEGGTTPPPPIETGQLITSSILSSTPSPTQNFNNNRPPSRPDLNPSDNNNNNNDDDDFFQGDFAVFNRPSSSSSSSSFNSETSSLDTSTCGTVIIPPKPLITHGQGTHEAEFPWHAALYHAKGIDLTYFCGASLITRKHLITVAHCVTRRRSNNPIGVDDMVVYLGKYYLKRWSNPGIQNKNIEKITIHPKYNPHNYNNDIAILKLTQLVDITDYVRTICLWDENNINLNNIVGKIGTVVGWGFDENGKVTEQLTKAHMLIVSQETCIYSFPDFYSRFTSSQTFCSGFKNGTSVCNGDSGGGLVLPKSTSNNNKQIIWQLRGLVSISVALQNQLKCDSSHYVVFTDVAKYLDWIKNLIK